MVDFKKIASKWQKRWEDKGIFKVKEDPKKKKFYCLEMYPYPSNQLHIGHLRNYSIGDCLARYKRMQGFNVLYPMGYDAFGLPAENAAIKHGIDPEKWTLDNIKAIKSQQQSMGLSYDWDRQIQSCTTDYYKWNQWIFLKFFEKGLAYKKNSFVNWCPSCNTVLANEQVEDGKCWRCKNEVDHKSLEQWYFKITDYAEELLQNLEKLEHWPERVKIMQKNWIGKSQGVNLKFKVKDMDIWFDMYDSVPQTYMAQTFTIIAPEHPKVLELVKGTKYEKKVMEFVEKIKKKKLTGKFDIETDMEGIFTGKYIEYTAANKDLPIWIASFVVADYGSGIVNCSAHDERDFVFAKKYDIPLHPVMFPADKKEAEKVRNLEYCYFKAEEGILEEPKEFKGRKWKEAREDIIKFIVSKKHGQKAVQFKLKDWLISRQRYWGTPIPIIYCDKCGTVPVPEKDLPVKLPKNVKFTGKGNPLETSEDFVNAKCPKCKGKAKRETDTMDTFVDSSWYFLRYCSPKEDKLPFSKKSADYWMPVNQYIGGIEHAIMHLLYARFFIKALRDLGLHKIDEPFSRLLCQGMVIKDGAKMSKSIGNIVDPKEIMDKYGPDTARLFILFTASPEKELDWSDKGVNGAFRFLNRIFYLADKVDNSKSDSRILNKIHRTIKIVSENIDNFEYNKAIVNLYGYVDYLSKLENIPKEAFETLLLLLAPFTPHLSEELWEKLGNKKFISLEKWPKFDSKKINDKIEKEEISLQNTLDDIRNVLKLVKIKAKKLFLYMIPNEKEIFVKNKGLFENEFSLEVNIFAVNDKDIYDPQGKAKKAKPGKVAIYLE
jgi:leucyl-tRNA synthetase